VQRLKLLTKVRVIIHVYLRGGLPLGGCMEDASRSRRSVLNSSVTVQAVTEP
jgi:hypothetical protein